MSDETVFLCANAGIKSKVRVGDLDVFFTRRLAPMEQRAIKSLGWRSVNFKQPVMISEIKPNTLESL